MNIGEALIALRDLRKEVEEMTARVGWSGHGARARADALLEQGASIIAQYGQGEEHRAELIEAARKLYCQRSDNNIEVDDDAMLSEGDYGTWVQGWLWVRDEDEDSEEDSDEVTATRSRS